MPRGYPVVALFVICAACFWMRVEHISASLPYSQHIDERAITKPAARILTSGNYHPSNFEYPSFPRYLAAAGMAVGFVIAAPDLKIGKRIEIQRDLGDVFPF